MDDRRFEPMCGFTVTIDLTREENVMNANRLGPFTGRQLTTIIVTLIVVALFPIGAWAVTGSNIFVTDATSGAHAKVDGNGNLQTKVSSGFVDATPAAPNQQ